MLSDLLLFFSWTLDMIALSCTMDYTVSHPNSGFQDKLQPGMSLSPAKVIRQRKFFVKP